MEFTRYSAESDGLVKVKGSFDYSVEIGVDDILKWIDLQENPTILDIVRHHVHYKMVDLIGEPRW